ncbi:type I restriction endonuclease subunit R [bacterium]|nr:type I restriction endonuclease subunit R [bacterium]
MKLIEQTLTEQPAIEWFKSLGYDYAFGPKDLVLERRDYRQVILERRLKEALVNLNPGIPQAAIEETIEEIQRIEHPDLIIANKNFYRLLIQGVPLKIDEEKWDYVKLIDFEQPERNDFLIVNQFSVQGTEKVRRPDLIVFVNGLPLALFEFKNPATENATIDDAYDQVMKGYKKDIPDIFKYNQVIVISDLLEAKHGTISSTREWFSVWKKIENENEKTKGVNQLEVLIKGIFHKARFLDIVQNFIIFEKEGSTFVKKMPLYHQYFGVNKAIEATKTKVKPKGDGRIGVFWHTQGSGKSISMIFYVNKVRQLKELKNPAFVFLTDRNDLDNQLFKKFKRCGLFPKQAKSIRDLRERLKRASGDIIFTTIQKFETEREEEKYPLLSKKHNLIVIADEAHRSQYAKLAGNARQAMPNASFLGFTGTPISLRDRDTRLVFGDYISVYPIDRAVEDKAVVPIYYEGRLVPLHLTNEFIDEDFDHLTANLDTEAKEELKKRYSRLEKLISDPDRLEKIARDIVWHFNHRAVEGKAMVVTISRKVAVKMYKLISKNPEAPECAVAVSGLTDFKGKVQDDLDVEQLKERFVDPDDPLKMVIVCDMWLTGFDVPCLATMYMDKPLKNHTLMQAIARVNRVFKDKQGGLIVDYIGIADDLRKALNIYSEKEVKEALIPLEELIERMHEKYDIVRSYFAGMRYKSWHKLPGRKLARLFQRAINKVITDEETGRIDEEKQKRFIKEATALFKLWAFIRPHPEADKIQKEVEFFQAIKKNIVKRVIVRPLTVEQKIETTVKELIAESIAADKPIDILEMQGKKKPEVSIFDEEFLKRLKQMAYPNLAIQVLRKLLSDEINSRLRKNIVRYDSLRERLEEVIEKYEKKFIDSAETIDKLIDLAKEIKAEERKGQKLGLSEEELAFYDALTKGKKYIKEDKELRRLAKEVVQAIKEDLAVDWTNNDVLLARIRGKIKRILYRSGIPPQEAEPIAQVTLKQAQFLFEDAGSSD